MHLVCEKHGFFSTDAEDVCVDCLLARAEKAEESLPSALKAKLESAETRIAELEAKLADLSGEVREWLCETCNTVYPGPPAPGIWCARCPKCDGSTGPRNGIELRKARAAISIQAAQIITKDDRICELQAFGIELQNKVDAQSARIAALREALETAYAFAAMFNRDGDECWDAAKAKIRAALAQPAGDAEPVVPIADAKPGDLLGTAKIRMGERGNPHPYDFGDTTEKP